MTLEKTTYLANLFTYYAPLLTKKQQTYFKLYYFQNLTMQEIADLMHISKAGAHDALKRIGCKLVSYEKKLTIYKQQLELKTELNKIANETNNELLLALLKRL